MKKLSQKEKVIEKLKQDGYVDNFWAINTKTSVRLGAIIFELKEAGYVFDEVRSGFVAGTKNWRYYLLTAPMKRVQQVTQLPDNTVRVEYKEVPLFN